MTELSLLQLAFVGLIFVWSGFVRAGLGFGGNAMTLPLALLVIDDPILWLPIFASHLLVFSTVALYGRLDNIEWRYLWRALVILIIPKIAGVFGLLNLPTDLVVNAIYVITGVYAVTYILDTGFRSSGRVLDTVLLVIGGYASGVSLIGAPLISAVFTRHVPLHKVRDTLFFLWVILVSIKMSTFIAMDVDLQLSTMCLLLLPASLGHWLGSRAHQALIRGDGRRFKIVLGCALLGVCSYGLWTGIVT